MNKNWSEWNHTLQEQIKKKDTYPAGLDTLFALRKDLMETLLSFREELTRDDFDMMPFPRASGYHSKTIAYSLWHIFRIEDIVAHTLIQGDEQVFFSGGYLSRIGSPIITTGNELKNGQIAEFSKRLDLEALYAYLIEVKESTEALLLSLPYESLKQKIPAERREKLLSLQVVSPDEEACWLVDYWCQKDVRGLIQMPFSRHWIMHTEACLRIKSKLGK